MTPVVNLARLLDVPGFRVAGWRRDNGVLWVDLIHHKRRLFVCSGCGERCRSVHDRQWQTARDLGAFGLKTLLRYELVRVRCAGCGVRVERIDWLARNPRYTRRFAYQVARLCLAMPLSAAAAVAGIAWHAAAGIMEDVAAAEIPPDTPPENLRFIGIDEKSWRKGRRYCTIVSDLVSGRIIWVGEGRSEKNTAVFFKWLGRKRCKQIESAAIDLAPAYEAVVRKYCPNVKPVYDRYHVIKLLLEATNTVRKEVVRNADKDERGLLTDKKWLLLKHARRLKQDAKEELQDLLEINQPLATAHILKEDFLRLYDIQDEQDAGEFLAGWTHRAVASGLKPFVKFALMVANRLDGFINHTRCNIPMGIVEALNSRLQALIYRSRGFRTINGFITTAQFVCGKPANLISDRSVFPSSL